jgi:hypothetical protein
MREDGFLRRILPPVTITNDEFDRQVDTDTPMRVVDADAPFQSLPENRYIRGPRYRVMFNRILSPRFRANVEVLSTYDMNIRDVLSDNAIRESQEDLRKRGYRTLREIRMAKTCHLTPSMLDG